jgi:tight adherence protein C
MIDQIAAKMFDLQFLLALSVGIGTIATILSIGMPLLERSNLDGRMKAVTVERDKIRAKEREKLFKEKPKVRHQTATGKLKEIVDHLNLSKHLHDDRAKTLLNQAGLRSQQAEYGFLFARMALPSGLFILASGYALAIMEGDMSIMMRLGIGLFAGYIGLQLPMMYLKNMVEKRQSSMRRAFPDALDLLLICVETGMALEPSFNKVASEIGGRSVELAEEMSIVTAELSYLPQRRTALENFATRTGLDDIKQLTTVLIQSERYGTPLGSALRVISQESRDIRMLAAEKKAASLPPKLTVPMILFFLPVLFAVIITPAVIQIQGVQQ